MTVYSQNGYVANDTSVLDTYTVPGSTVRMRLRKGPVAAVLLHLASQFDDEVEDIDTAGSFIADAKPSIPGGEPSRVDDDWSTAFRNVRGSTTTLSNHASGTAIDLNATQHPRGVRGTFTAAQIRAVRAILAELRDPATGRCVVRWGEDYKSAPVDGMHFEINADEAAVTRVAATLGEDMDLNDKVSNVWTPPAKPGAPVTFVDTTVNEVLRRASRGFFLADENRDLLRQLVKSNLQVVAGQSAILAAVQGIDATGIKAVIEDAVKTAASDIELVFTTKDGDAS